MGKQQLSLLGELKKAAQPGAVIPGRTQELSRTSKVKEFGDRSATQAEVVVWAKMQS